MSGIGSFISSMLLYSCPLLFAAMGVLILETAGIIHMAAEGLLITGAYTAVVASAASGSVWVGALCAMLVTALFGMLFAVLVQELAIDQTILGIAFNLVGIGLTTTLCRAFGTDAVKVTDRFPTDLLGFPLPVLLGLISVFLMMVFFRKTNSGIRLRSAGENPQVVEAMGISVRRLRYRAAFVSSLFIGFGGAVLSTCLLSQFTENMSAGRGFFALAAVTFGNYHPLGTLAGVMVFGAGETLSYRLQTDGTGFPYELALMIPYILIIVCLCLFSRRSKDPDSLGRPYHRS